MNNLTVLTVLVLITCFSLTAQDNIKGSFETSWGDNYDLPNREMHIGLASHPEKGVVNVTTGKMKNCFIHKFDWPSLQMTNKQEIATKEFGNDAVVDEFAKINNEYFMFYSTWDDPHEHLYYRKVSAKDGSFKGEKQEMVEAGKLSGRTIQKGFFGIIKYNKYNFHFSNDSSRILVTYRLVPDEEDDKKNQDKIGFHVFDKNLNKIWGKEIRMPHTEYLMDNLEYAVDNNGNAYMLAKIYENKRDFEEYKNMSVRYDLMKITENKDKMQQLTLDMGDRFFESVTLKENNQGHIVCGGYYTKIPNPDIRSADGVFTFTIDDFNIVNQSFIKFSKKFLKKYESDESLDKLEETTEEHGEDEARNLVLHQLISYDDGSFLVIGEKFFTNYGSLVTSKYVETNYQDIFLMKVNPSGNKAWSHKIAKNQVGEATTEQIGNFWNDIDEKSKKSTTSGTLSLKYFRKNNSHFIIYVDHQENLNLKADEAPERHVDRQGGYLTVCKINGKGKSKAHLFNVRDKEVNIFPTKLKDVTPTSFVGQVQDNEEGGYKMMRLKFKDR